MTRSLLIAVLFLAPRVFAADSDESVPPGEAEASAQISGLIGGTVAKDNKETGSAHRDAHAKAHGCVRASFRVNDRLPPELRQGIFQEGRVYKSWIRYSNGSGRAANDSKGDGRGMAIKLFGVPGPKLADDEKATQDFLLINSPVFFVRNASDYVKFSKAEAADKPFSFFIGWDPFRWRIHELLAAFSLIHKKTSNPLDIRYWSLTPFLMGDSGPAKFSARPCATAAAGKPDKKNPDFLRDALAARLKDGGACFNFLVQLRTDPPGEPIEDPTVKWREKKSPFVQVATIDIPAQSFDGPEQQKFCENISMNPWHSVPEHRPLGGINRVRKVVYEAVSKLRHGLNGVARSEPTGEEKFQ
ncbi:MAG: catalase family protein [Elusimicrobiota bacterium]